MTARDRKLLAALIPLVVIGALWFLVVSPKRKEISRLDDQVTSAQVKLSQAQQTLAANQAAERELRQNIEALARAGRAVPVTASIPPLLRQLERTATQAGVKLQVVDQGGSGSDASSSSSTDSTTTTSTPGTPAGVTAVNLSLTFQGRFFDVEGFFRRLDRFIKISRQQVQATGRLLSVSSLDLGVGPNGFPSLTANVTASVYALPDLRTLISKAGAPLPAGSDPATATPAPAGATASVPSADPASEASR